MYSEIGAAAETGSLFLLFVSSSELATMVLSCAFVVVTLRLGNGLTVRVGDEALRVVFDAFAVEIAHGSGVIATGELSHDGNVSSAKFLLKVNICGILYHSGWLFDSHLVHPK